VTLLACTIALGLSSSIAQPSGPVLFHPPLRLREASQAVAAEVEARRADADARRGAASGWGAGPAAPPALGQAYRPEEWVEVMAERLDVKTGRLAGTARWFATAPRQLDVRASRFFLKVRLERF
jgi:hypothetical protein